MAQVPGYGEAVCAWKDVPAEAGADERHGTSRRRKPEAKQIACEVQRLLAVLPSDMSVGVITFYTAQRDCIFEELAGSGFTEKGEGSWRVRPEHASNAQCPERLRIGTVDAFQGKEFDVVLLSVVPGTTSSPWACPTRRTAKKFMKHRPAANTAICALPTA